MNRFLRWGLWISVVLGVLAFGSIAGYAWVNDSGHTGWDPFTCLFLFVPMVLCGVVGIALRRRFQGAVRASVCALIVGLAGITLIVVLDQSNQLVQYERWIRRGMP